MLERAALEKKALILEEMFILWCRGRNLWR
jgi:hypothetical protein